MTALENKCLSIPSATNYLIEVETFIDHIFLEYEIDIRMQFSIKLSVCEAVTNSILHGNENSDSDIVSIRFEYSDRYLIFTVSDCGKGFNYNRVYNPLDNENIKAESGRGIFLMKKYSSKLRFFKNGSSVKLYFDL